MASAPTAQETAAKATLAAMRGGDLLAAFDHAERGLRNVPDDLELKYLSVLALARSGGTELASKRFQRLGLGSSGAVRGHLAVDIPALAARLDKDRALAAQGPDRTRLLLCAAEAYEALFAASGDPYPGVNAAALTLWAGDRKKAAAMASDALATLRRSAGSEKDYWSFATEAELHLLRGDTARAAETIQSLALQVGSAEPVDWQAIASTRRQIRRTCQHLGIDPVLLEPLRPPMVITYSGHMIGSRFNSDNEDQVAAAIRAQLAKKKVGCGFGSLAGGADILFAEALLEEGAELNVVLPFSREDFIAHSVRPSGPTWPDRFERCLSRAHTVRYATNDSYLGDDTHFQYAAKMAMGCAILRARLMDALSALFALWDGAWPSELGKIAGTASDLWFWQSLGHESWVVAPDGRSMESPAFGPYRPTAASGGERINGAILFADVQGYSRLRESDLPGYADAILEPVARLLDARGAHVLTRNSWGDAIFAVFDDVAVAAECALAMQKTIAALDREVARLPFDLNIRIAVHFGPIRAIFDPIQGRQSYMGVQVVQTARIEPVTEPGMIYVTEAFAAALTLIPGADFACDYLGEVDTAKGYGRLALYALRASMPGD